MKKQFAPVVLFLALSVGLRAEDKTSLPTPAEPTTVLSAVDVLEGAVGSAVENRELIGASDSFDSTVTRVYCWTRAKASSTPATLHHVWSLNGAKVADVPLTINVSPARTWSYRAVAPGSWKVDVTDDAGQVLKTLSFTVSKETSEPLTTPAPATTPQ